MKPGVFDLPTNPGQGRFSLPWIGYLLGMIAISLFVYRESLGFGFNSDAYVLIANVRQSFYHAIRWDGTYHYIPVTAVWLWLQQLVFDMNQPMYQILNTVQHGLMAGLVCLVALRLGIKPEIAAVAGLIYAVSGNSYQVVLWSVVGSNYFVSGVFYLTFRTTKRSGFVFFGGECRVTRRRKTGC